jgi:hypothetical protein
VIDVEALGSLLERFREAQERFDNAARGSADRLVAAREERGLRAAIGEAAFALLPTLLETLIGLQVRVTRLEGLDDANKAEIARLAIRVSELRHG